jgi:YgiT-type zinc finger domain-containing protein
VSTFQKLITGRERASLESAFISGMATLFMLLFENGIFFGKAFKMFKKDICPLCGGKKKRGKSTFTVNLGDGVLVVRDVPALICGQRGKDWIEDKVAARLEKLANEARKKHLQVEVAAFA